MRNELNRKGVSDLVATVLLVLIVLVIITFAVLFFTGILGGVQSQAEGGVQKRIIEIKSTFALLSQDGIKVMMRNTGSIDIEGDAFVKVYLNGMQTDGYIPVTIKPGEVGYMNVWDIYNIEGPAGTNAELVVPGKAMTQRMNIEKPEEIPEEI